MEKYRHTAINELPEKADFVLEVTNKKPHWFLRYGSVIVLLLIASAIAFLYFRLGPLIFNSPAK
ncbi:MAG: hypothetical protein WCF67_12405 [Chitinophagaceae bacterium]